jgi:hypothetical protein
MHDCDVIDTDANILYLFIFFLSCDVLSSQCSSLCPGLLGLLMLVQKGCVTNVAQRRKVLQVVGTQREKPAASFDSYERFVKICQERKAKKQRSMPLPAKRLVFISIALSS